MTNKETFIRFNTDINNNILTNPDFLKAEASGRMRKSVLSLDNIVVQDSFFSKKVLAYALAIDEGRKKNSVDSGGLFDAIYEWVGFKKYGITYKTDSRRKGIAYAITRKIAEEGSAKARGKYPKTNIFQSAINKALPSMLKGLITQKEINTRSEIVKAYKK